MNKLSIVSRILVAFASGALIAVFFLPAWRIDLFAPQYPEGLTMYIWINGISGDVDIINGLNHYIGMKHIKAEMFPEFKYLPFVVGFFMLLGMVVSITGNRKFLLAYLILTAIGGILALYDFYQWSYDYGHNLDPKAPIQVPGLSYQPPLIGHKRLLNFDAYSMPGVAGWIVIGAGFLAFSVWFVEWYMYRKSLRTRPGALSIPVIAAILVLGSCGNKPEPFVAGKDLCSFCKMGISDLRFGGELVTRKGKVFKFDDLHCMDAFLESAYVEENEISRLLTIDFEKPNSFLDAREASYLQAPELKSPMGSNVAAFGSRESAINYKNKLEAEILNWQELQDKLK